MTATVTTSVRRLLVANRGEIASRVFRTCRRLGIETVAVHSDADAALPFVREADHAVRLPGNAPSETYLRADLVLEAARASGADALHPGYGFLSENADFARAVEAAGLVWVGPAPASIECMGSKVEAKKLMEAAGVPVLPNLTVETVTEGDLPLLVKASAGGGGRGMRIVRSLAELPVEIEQAAAEAESAFGDGAVFVEPYVEHGRHVEVQVVGDGRGQVLVLGERDCSIQRRHQKVVEESPAPRLPDDTRAALHDAARRAAEAIDYRGAGTVEFLYDASADRFFFLEMNTRLQVEHPVTELVHGVDLVDLQIGVAEGAISLADPSVVEEGALQPSPSVVEEGAPQRSPSVVEEVAPQRSPSVVEEVALQPSRNHQPTGHAIEVRLYAEDPASDWQPQSGLLTTFEIPVSEGIRVDSGFESGSEVSTHYDAMLAKVVAHAPTRREAARKLASTLSRSRIHGLVTNRDLLVRVLRSPEFEAGDVSTDFFDRTDVLTAEVSPDPGAPVAAALALAERRGAARTVQRGIPVAWRNVVSQPQVTRFARGVEEVEVAWLGTRDGYAVDGFTVVSAAPTTVTLEAHGVRTAYDVAVAGDRVDVDSPHGHTALVVVPRFVDPADAVASGSLLAPMPGTVISVAVEAGAEVAAGQAVLVLEAMKMQHTVSAPYAGVVSQIEVTPGAQVTSGQVLAVVEASAGG